MLQLLWSNAYVDRFVSSTFCFERRFKRYQGPFQLLCTGAPVVAIPARIFGGPFRGRAWHSCVKVSTANTDGITCDLQMRGGPQPTAETAKRMEAMWPNVRSELTMHLVSDSVGRSHYSLTPVVVEQERFEQHLQDGRQWLFSTQTVSYADMSAHMPLAWARSLKSTGEVFDKTTFPKTIAVCCVVPFAVCLP
jgi:hypothetical protein